ncbi:MAG TPA: hypothetical protein PLD59_02355 [Tepidisphaeraceae bacterium]|nr:hypothetical protein [Tepidisphaeraceae bacterium]
MLIIALGLVPVLGIMPVPGACFALSEAPAASPAVDTLLDGLEARGNDLRTLHATISKSEADASLGEDTETRTGRLWYDRQAEADVRIRVSLDKLRIGEKEREDRIEYMLIDGTLTDRNYRSRVEVQRIVQKPGQKLDLFKLGQGPFPLPIGQPRAAVYEQFDVSELPAGDDAPRNTSRLKLVPKPGTELTRRFAWIEVWVDRTDFLPRRISTLNAQQSVLTTTVLQDVQLNTPLASEAFSLEKVNEREWSIRVEAD